MTKKKPFSIWITITLGTVICIITVLTLAFMVLLKGTFADRGLTQKVGDPAPDFTIFSLDGQLVSFDELHDRAVIINLWTTWCEPCKAEMPLLEAASQKHAENLTVLGINEGDKKYDVKSYIKEENITFRVLLDESENVGYLYGIVGYPTSIFIDKNGIIQAIYLGELSHEQLESNLQLIGIE